MADSNSQLSIESKQLMFGEVHIATIQSLVTIATALVYYYSQNLQFELNSMQIAPIILSIIGGLLLFNQFSKRRIFNLKAWHLLVIFSVFALVFNYEATSHAQILEQIDDAIGDVGTAAGNSFAANVLEAIIELIRIAIYIVVGAAVIAAIAFGVTQGQWQAPLLVIGTVAGIGLFLEIMGVVVFGAGGGGGG